MACPILPRPDLRVSGSLLSLSSLTQHHSPSPWRAEQALGKGGRGLRGLRRQTPSRRPQDGVGREDGGGQLAGRDQGLEVSGLSPLSASSKLRPESDDFFLQVQLSSCKEKQSFEKQTSAYERPVRRTWPPKGLSGVRALSCSQGAARTSRPGWDLRLLQPQVLRHVTHSDDTASSTLTVAGATGTFWPGLSSCSGKVFMN